MPVGLTFDAKPGTAAFRSIYAAAFAPPPWHETPDQIEAFADRLASHARTPGFRCDAAYVDGEPAGFVYGFPSPDPWPDDRLYRPIADAVGDLSMLASRFELHEVAVDPRFAGRGVGAALVRRLTAGVGASWLVTAPKAAAAVRLYERLGWRRLREFTVRGETFRLYLSPDS
ncbi:N-acetyltransferase family protein [Streptosporangium sp. CA-135522]|uniref:GNAT family N-acetyltransferase n=1 Tax=Streptosporangium sp. CA-135522 TaxID=3240072 RepID=UPI003D901E39